MKDRWGDYMNELIEVKEYDTIIGNYKFKEQYRYINETAFLDLIEFIHAFDSSNEESDVLDFIKIGYKRKVGETVSFKNYVGIIQIKNNYQIQILPKINFAKGKQDETKKVFIKMLSSMKDFPSKIFTNANLKVDQMSLYEIFINIYLQEVQRLVKRGLKSYYVKQSNNLSTFKGKLDVVQHLKYNLVHKERFYVEFDEYQINRPENKIVKATLLKLKKLATSFENSKEIRQLLIAFEQVQPSINYDKDFSRIIIGRNNKDYKNLINWSKVFLKNKSFTSFAGTESVKALLFPMEKVFESFIAKNVKKTFSNLGWQISIQDKGYYLFNSLNGINYNKFALRPDIVLQRPDGAVIVLDTKWKSLINNKNKNFGILQADMYQMYAYAKKYNTSQVWLIYPANNELHGDRIIVFDSDDDVKVSLFFIDLTSIEFEMKRLVKLLS